MIYTYRIVAELLAVALIYLVQPLSKIIHAWITEKIAAENAHRLRLPTFVRGSSDTIPDIEKSCEVCMPLEK